MAIDSGVYAVYEEKFEVNVGTGSTPNWVTIADVETFSPTFDNGIEEWNPMENKGWMSRLMTAKSCTVALTAKRCIGDAGNDFIASMAMKNGTEAQADFRWTFAEGTVVAFNNAVINVTEAGGDSTNVAPLVFEVLSNGKPTVS